MAGGVGAGICDYRRLFRWAFVVDWASWRVTALANVTISLTFQDGNKDAKQ